MLEVADQHIAMRSDADKPRLVSLVVVHHLGRALEARELEALEGVLQQVPRVFILEGGQRSDNMLFESTCWVEDPFSAHKHALQWGVDPLDIFCSHAELGPLQEV